MYLGFKYQYKIRVLATFGNFDSIYSCLYRPSGERYEGPLRPSPCAMARQGKARPSPFQIEHLAKLANSRPLIDSRLACRFFRTNDSQNVEAVQIEIPSPRPVLALLSPLFPLKTALPLLQGQNDDS